LQVQRGAVRPAERPAERHDRRPCPWPQRLSQRRARPAFEGIKVNTSPTDFAPIEQLQMQKFDGEKWNRFGPVMSGESS
jgi:hypothetical protein